MSGNVKCTNKLFLVKLMYICSNEHINTVGLKKGFQHPNIKGEIITFWLYILLLDSQGYIQCSYLPFVFPELKSNFLKPLCIALHQNHKIYTLPLFIRLGLNVALTHQNRSVYNLFRVKTFDVAAKNHVELPHSC